MLSEKTLKNIWFYYEFTGPITLVTAYFLNTYSIIDNRNILATMNLYGALLIGYSSFLKKNYPTVMLEVFWAGISIFSYFY